MPRSFKLTSEAREALLKDAQAWRDSFSNLAKSKDPSAAAVAKPIVGFVDGISASVNHALEQVDALKEESEKTVNGINKQMGMTQAALGDLSEQQKVISQLEDDHDATKKLGNSNDKRCNRALNYIQRMQLEQSATVIVLRGIRPRTQKKESYMDLVQLFQQVMQSIRVDGIRPIFVRRLPQAAANRNEPAALKVKLLTLEDKVRIYAAFDAALKEHQHLPFGVANEIPQYALGSYKYQMRLAAEVRAKYPGTKTRVGIARNATWPGITVRGKNEKQFSKIDEKVFEEARAEVTRKQKRLSEAKRERREAALLEQGLDDEEVIEEMETQSTSGATNRPSRQAAMSKKRYN